MTEEQIQKERAAFEEWFGAPNGLNRTPEGHYVHATAHDYWNVWLAAKRHAEQYAHADTARLDWYENRWSDFQDDTHIPMIYYGGEKEGFVIQVGDSLLFFSTLRNAIDFLISECNADE